MLMPCACAKLLQGSMRGSKMVAEKLWCRVYGMTDITHSSPSLCLSPLQTHVLHSLHIISTKPGLYFLLSGSHARFVPVTIPKMVIIRSTDNENYFMYMTIGSYCLQWLI